ncbi:c-type cytochrome [Herbaspirillum frisingense]|uniref:c-type cytochrome n=1 Tax=Herbaspirillum frisingense TaxID=92645 RepID=UPI001F1663DD|nr:c-type cytochrome [Herbaspirillum frisingense]UIN22442.1 c-type cytochrome [Herbaspirillum frisingense]
MKYLLLIATLVAGSAISAEALANAQLAKAKNCMACHSVDAKIVGPAFKDVAKKYAGQKDAEAKLTQKVLNGGSGAWGAVAMPANKGQVSEAEARELVKWVLSLK